MEFGATFGLSTLFLAAAVSNNGTGHIVTTELSQKKVAAARANLDEAGVGAAVSILPGDALETLDGVPGPVQLVPAIASLLIMPDALVVATALQVIAPDLPPPSPIWNGLSTPTRCRSPYC